jgi:hypothetical protein
VKLSTKLYGIVGALALIGMIVAGAGIWYLRSLGRGTERRHRKDGGEARPGERQPGPRLGDGRRPAGNVRLREPQ